MENDEALKTIRDYSEVMNDDYGEYLQLMYSLWSRRFCMTTSFAKALEKQIKTDALLLQEQYEIKEFSEPQMITWKEAVPKEI